MTITEKLKKRAEYMRHLYHTNDDIYLKSRLIAIRARCENPKDQTFRVYGGRGISVCQKWKENPKSFVDWSLSNGWKRGLQIDRIDTNGNYSPENCRWTTSRQNNRNRRNNKLDVEKVRQIRAELSKGIRGTALRLSEKYNVHHSLIYRIKKNKTWA
jgi:hypothetical protein